MHRLLGLALLVLAVAVAPAEADTFAPPKGRVFAGVAAQDPGGFTAHSGKRPAVYEQFVRWGASMEYVYREAESSDARLMLALSTAKGQNLPGVISPGEIARGDGDRWLARFGERLAQHDAPVYLRYVYVDNMSDRQHKAL